MSRLILTILFFTVCLACIQVYADAPGSSAHNAAGHAPIGVMGDHIHGKK